MTAIFNRGIISTQHVSQALKDDVSKNKLPLMIKDPANQLRADLAGDITGTLTVFVAQAKKGRSIHAALYELTNVELVRALKGIGDKLNIVLANTVARPTPGENDGSETMLKASAGSLATALTENRKNSQRSTPR